MHGVAKPGATSGRQARYIALHLVRRFRLPYSMLGRGSRLTRGWSYGPVRSRAASRLISAPGATKAIKAGGTAGADDIGSSLSSAPQDYPLGQSGSDGSENGHQCKGPCKARVTLSDRARGRPTSAVAASPRRSAAAARYSALGAIADPLPRRRPSPGAACVGESALARSRPCAHPARRPPHTQLARPSDVSLSRIRTPRARPGSLA